MKKWYLIASYVCILICIQYSFADGFDYLGQIKKYIKCEAALNVAANVLSESEEDFYQHEYHHASIDSRIVALEFARAGGYSAKQVDDLFYSYLSEYRAVVQESDENNELDVFMAELKPLVEECKDLNALQADIIEREREEMKYIEKNRQ